MTIKQEYFFLGHPIFLPTSGVVAGGGGGGGDNFFRGAKV